MKELEDLDRFPATWRNFQTEFIGFVVKTFPVYQPFVTYIRSLSLSPGKMIDLCSGSGEPAISIFRQSRCFTVLELTDKYPNPPAVNDTRILYRAESTDVLDMQWERGVCYTMFNAFHHFDDGQKKRIAEGIRRSGSRAFFVEILQPDVFCLFKVLLLTTAGNLLFTPFVKPFSLKRLFFTYILPVNLVTITWDGMVSVLKSLSVKQYQKLFEDQGSAAKVFRLGYAWAPLVVIQVEAEQQL